MVIIVTDKLVKGVIEDEHEVTSTLIINVQVLQSFYMLLTSYVCPHLL